jgi:hypothetical protein
MAASRLGCWHGLLPHPRRAQRHQFAALADLLRPRDRALPHRRRPPRQPNVLLRRPRGPDGRGRPGRGRRDLLQLQPRAGGPVDPRRLGAGHPGGGRRGPLRRRRRRPDPAARRGRDRLGRHAHTGRAGPRGGRRVRPRGPPAVRRQRRPELARRPAPGDVARAHAAARVPRRRAHLRAGLRGPERHRGHRHAHQDRQGIPDRVREGEPRLERARVGGRRGRPHRPRPARRRPR